MGIIRKYRKRKNNNAITTSVYYTSAVLKKIFLFSLKIGFILFLIASFTLAGLVVGSMAAYIDSAPLITDDQLIIEDLTTFIYDNDGNVITQLQGSQNMNRIIVDYDE